MQCMLIDITYNHLVSRIHPQSLDMLECEK
nr:MAG TPA: hypothetical protein [Caudoviricetes sp.]